MPHVCRSAAHKLNRRLVALDNNGITFKWKDYRIEGPERYKLMTLDTHEFIRRFLMHVLPQGFHRIRYYGLLASGKRAENIARARKLLAVPLIPIDAIKAATTKPDDPKAPEHPCPCCGGRMIIIETFERGSAPRYRPTAPTVAIGKPCSGATELDEDTKETLRAVLQPGSNPQ